jgi:hypothetical protein
VWATRRRHAAGSVTMGDRACRTLRDVVKQHPNKLAAIYDEAQAAHDQAIVDELDRQAADDAQEVGDRMPGDPRPLTCGPAYDVIQGWNLVAGPRKWTTGTLSAGNRTKAATALRRVGFREEWAALLKALDAKGWPWELGRPGPHQGWRPSLKWILKPENMADVLDKLGSAPGPAATPAVKTAAEHLAELKAKQAARRAAEAAAATTTTGGEA